MMMKLHTLHIVVNARKLIGKKIKNKWRVSVLDKDQNVTSRFATVVSDSFSM